MMLLAKLLDELPEELSRQVFTHASWSERPGDSYTRLAFLGDSVLGLAITAHLYPRLEAERFGAGRLTKIRAQAVSGASCSAVAERLELPRRMRQAAPAAVRESAAALSRNPAGAALRIRCGSPRRSATARQETPETAWARIFVSRPAPKRSASSRG